MDSPVYDLEERLLEYAAVVRLEKDIEESRAGNHIGGQLLRSGTSPYLHHGEAEAAESPKDFVHKLGVCLKELRETKRALRLVARVPLVVPPSKADRLLAETEELIKIFYASIRTANRRLARECPDAPYAAQP
jgi:four helix bundle protein